MPKDEFDGLPVIDVPESEGITVVVKSFRYGAPKQVS